MTQQQAMTPDELEQALRRIGEECYHHRHPFQLRLQNGELNKAQVQAWALNRYYYQAMIPIKDASFMARCFDPAIRREWRQRIIDHDGDSPEDGGIRRWLALTDGLGLDREMVESTRKLLPQTRHAVDAYVHYVAERSLLEAVASSLTELFSPIVIPIRMQGMLAHYDFISRDTLAYFEPRLTQAPRDADFALRYVKQHALTWEQQQQVLDALRFKCGVLWSLLDALDYAYVVPGNLPPGAFDPKRDV